MKSRTRNINKRDTIYFAMKYEQGRLRFKDLYCKSQKRF